MAKILAAFLMVASAATAQVTGIGNFIHNVADLDRSVAFYRDILGMEMQRPPGDWQTTEAVLKLYNAVGGKFRVATAQVPGVNMRVELAEFQGVERKPMRLKPGEPGASLLMLSVRNLEPILQRLDAAKVPLLGNSVSQGYVLVSDPDGFLVVVLKDGLRTNKTQPASNFVDLTFAHVESRNSRLSAVFKALRLDPQRRARRVATLAETAMSQLKSPARQEDVALADGFELFLMVRYDKARPVAPLRPQDPGAAVLRLIVSDIDSAVRSLIAAGVPVASEGGAIQTLPGNPGRRAVILRAPDNLFVQLMR